MSQQLNIHKNANCESEAVWWKPFFSLQRTFNNQLKEAVSHIFQPSFISPSLWQAQDEAINALQHNAHRVCCKLFNQRQMATPWFVGSTTEPYVDIIENEKSIKLKADLPGLDAKDLEVSVADNSVTIQGSRQNEKKEEGETYFRQECCASTFSRTVALPVEVDANNASAEFEKNVLTVTIPKKVVSQNEAPHFKINIKNGTVEQTKTPLQHEEKHKSKVA